MQRKGAPKGKPAAREADGAAAPKPAQPDQTLGGTAAPPTAPTPQVAKPAVKAHVPRVSLPRPGERGVGPTVAPIIDARVSNEPEHRQFPRARLATRFELWREEGGRRTFAASFTSQNVSVSGAFLESTFFMPMGTELNARFILQEGGEPVLARAQIVREERSGPGGRSGFGIRFVEFSGQTEVSLARLFLGVRLREFVEEYLRSRRARSLSSELSARWTCSPPGSCSRPPRPEIRGRGAELYQEGLSEGFMLAAAIWRRRSAW